MCGKTLRGAWTALILLGLVSFSAAAEERVFFIENSDFEINDHTQEEHGHTHTLTPEQERRFYEQAYQKGQFEILDFRFEQTDWRECTDKITGNYTGFNCANRRKASQILKDYMDQHMPVCVQEALDSIGEGELDQIHIIHDGVLGDRRHSPRSLHAENRAIDINTFRVRFYDGREVSYKFKDTKNRPFYSAFRKCWGKAVHQNNGCPLYGGNVERTGSIGWEDRNHQHHMHTSVPYCVSGSYGGYYFRR